MRLRFRYKLFEGFSVSIHASVKDATTQDVAISFAKAVSIHASVKDATWTDNPDDFKPPSFNPRICKRCDLWPVLYIVSIHLFQSTHL